MKLAVVLAIIVLALFLIACSSSENVSTATKLSVNETVTVLPTVDPTPTTSPGDGPDEPYPGVFLDERFPITTFAGTLERQQSGHHLTSVGSVKIEFNGYTPRRITNHEGNSLRIDSSYPGSYTSYAVGSAMLLGDAKEVVYVLTRTGVVCCSQTILFDVSGSQPRIILNSEDYGRFRGGTEIFDVDGDGILEIAKPDSCFRYFMDDCGSCSPEPKAVFRFNEQKGTYLPAKGIQQEFERANLAQNEEFIGQLYRSWKQGDPVSWSDLERNVKSHVVDLLWIGEEKRAWEFLDRFAPMNKEKIKNAMKNQLKECGYYQAISKQR